MNPTCPSCGGHDIVEVNLVVVHEELAHVYADGEIETVSGTSEVDWSTCLSVPSGKRFFCKGCGEEFGLGKLVRASRAALPKWIRAWIKWGDDMACPVCRQKQIETQDRTTFCRSCGWKARNLEAR